MGQTLANMETRQFLKQYLEIGGLKYPMAQNIRDEINRGYKATKGEDMAGYCGGKQQPEPLHQQIAKDLRTRAVIVESLNG